MQRGSSVSLLWTGVREHVSSTRGLTAIGMRFCEGVLRRWLTIAGPERLQEEDGLVIAFLLQHDFGVLCTRRKAGASNSTKRQKKA